MSHGRQTIFLLAAILAGSLALLTAAGASAAPGASTTVLQPSAAAAVSPEEEVGATPAETPIDFSVALALGDQAGAEALERSVSDPSSASYRQYLTAAQWEKRFSPSQASVKAARSWLESQGVTVEGVTPDRMTIQASATAATVQKAFCTQLKQYRQLGRVLRLGAAPLNVPSAWPRRSSASRGVDQNLATPDKLTGGEPQSRRPAGRQGNPPAAGLSQRPTLLELLRQEDRHHRPAYGGGYPSPLPYALCGYVPAQLQGAYGLQRAIAKGIDGKGVTVAIVDAYASPTLFERRPAVQRSKTSPRSRSPAASSASISSKSFNDIELCEASEWFGEQTLDVEAVHATAPGANILYVGAKNCVNGLYNSVQQIVDGHLADIITNSWGDNGGDLLDSAGSRRSFDNVLLMAARDGHRRAVLRRRRRRRLHDLGMTVADYPPSQPVRDLGRRHEPAGQQSSTRASARSAGRPPRACSARPSLAAGRTPPAARRREAEQLARRRRPANTSTAAAAGRAMSTPSRPTSSASSRRHWPNATRSTTGIANRVEPDISMDADPTTGMLVGETQQFPERRLLRRVPHRRHQPVLAAVRRRHGRRRSGRRAARSASSTRALYEARRLGLGAGAYYDVVPGGKQALVRDDYLNEVNAKEGTITSARMLDYEGKIVFCRAKEIAPASRSR